MSDRSTELPALMRGFYKLDPAARVERLRSAGVISSAEAYNLATGGYTLACSMADKMIENVIGVFGLPLALVSNVRVNERDYLVPMVVEEPSIVAAASAAAGLALGNGGFRASADESLLIGQVELRDVVDPEKVRSELLSRAAEIIAAANAVHPNMVARGGGVVGIEVHQVSGSIMVLHLLVDTCDAMGANLVNTQCEAIAPLLESISSARAGLKILSNLTDRSLVRASMRVSLEQLARDNVSGESVRDAIIAADEFARADTYRAVTHNKGILNGIDPIAIATGNDWRAISAGIHAYAARGGHYRGLTRWFANADGALEGELVVPIKTGIVGASIAANPGSRFALSLMGVESAKELAMVMAAVGLGQNFSAIRALATVGIQSGHMKLHARGVIAAAGIPAHDAPRVLDRLIASGDIKEWNAREIHRSLNNARPELDPSAWSYAAGKVILCGEHAVVYGQPGVAIPISRALAAKVEDKGVGGTINLAIPGWNVRQRVDRDATDGVDAIVRSITKALELTNRSMDIDVIANFPAGVGLGGSASFAVAVIRALDRCFSLGLDDEAVNAHAFDAECIAHGSPSGLDNTMATYGRAFKFRRVDSAEFTEVAIGAPCELLIAVSDKSESTQTMVRRVRAGYEKFSAHFEQLFEAIGSLSDSVEKALGAGELEVLGALLDMNHGLLHALGVSTPELDSFAGIARANGALGAKLTGGGGGGSVVALCRSETAADVRSAFEMRNIRCFQIHIGPRQAVET